MSMVKDKRKKKDFYSGGGFKDAVMENYINGIYFNRATGINEVLSGKINKYNKVFLEELAQLNKEFYGLIAVYSTAINIIKKHEEHSFGDSRNLYRLITSQSGTIRFNRLLRIALKKYAVNKQEVYNSINSDIIKQKDRVERNKKLVLTLFEEYGMNNILEAVEKETGHNAFDYAVIFIDNAKDEYTFFTPEDTEKFYEDIKVKYADYIVGLADKYSISIYDDVTESLKKHRQVRQDISDKIKQDRKEAKMRITQEKINLSMSRDNIELQQAMDNLALIEDGSNERDYKIKSIQAKSIINRVVKEHWTIIWYIATCTKSVTRYIADTDKHGLKSDTTTSLAHAIWFRSKEEANKFVNENKELSDCKHMILSVHTYIGNNNNIWANVNVQEALGSILSEKLGGNISQNSLTLKALITSNGANTNNGRGNIIVYELSTLKGNPSGFLGSDKSICDIDDENLLMTRKNILNVNTISINDKIYNVKCVNVTFNNEFYTKCMKELEIERQILNELLAGRMNTEDLKKFGANGSMIDERMSSIRVDNLRKRISSVNEEMYAIFCIRTCGGTKEYIREVGDKLIYTDSAGLMGLYISYDNALKQYMKCIQIKKDRIFKICAIGINI